LIYAYDYDLAAGTLSNRRPFASTENLGGIPDGATVDAESHVWSAICEGAKLVRFRPDGSIGEPEPEATGTAGFS
jgi:sugar lactone lactonase YvrE